ncbi:MAG: hypothetical protein ABIJ47_01595 [Candidatus Bathyarchaeota archaeon]
MKPYVMPIVLGDCLMPIQFGYEPLDKKQRLPNLTGEYLKVLQRPMKPGLIEFVSTVIIGTMGYGKTEFAKWVAVKISEFYGAENVNAIMNRSADLKTIMGAMDSRPVQLLFLDDSFGEMPPDIARQFTRIRHRFHEVLTEAGKPESGVIVALFGIQDIYALDKLARRVSTAIIAKSSSGDKWYKSDLKKTFGEEGIRELDRITRRVTRNYDQGVKSRGIIALTGFEKPGFIKSEMVGEDLYTEILSPEKDEEAPQADAEVSGMELIEAQMLALSGDAFAFDEEPVLVELEADKKWRPRVEAYRSYLRGRYQDDVARDLGVTQGAVSKWLGMVRGEVGRRMGAAYEVYLEGSHRLRPDVSRVTRDGAKGRPDLVVELRDGSYEVISVKCFKSDRSIVTIPLEEIRPELNEAHRLARLGEPVRLLVDYLNLKTGQHEVTEISLDEPPQRLNFRESGS